MVDGNARDGRRPNMATKKTAKTSKTSAKAKTKTKPAGRAKPKAKAPSRSGKWAPGDRIVCDHRPFCPDPVEATIVTVNGPLLWVKAAEFRWADGRVEHDQSFLIQAAKCERR
jgi:hypothetical protein